MDYEEFKSYVRKSMEEITGGTVEIYPIVKNNSLVLDGLTGREREKLLAASPTIYLEPYFHAYEEGTPAPVLVSRILDVYEKRKQGPGIQPEQICDFEQMRKRIVFKLISRSRNQELLKKVPHRSFLDLEIVYYALFQGTEIPDATMLIEDSHLKLWNTGEEALYDLAFCNTPRLLSGSVRGMDEVMEEMVLEDIEEEIRSRVPKEKGLLKEEEMRQLSLKLLEQVRERQKRLPMYVLTNSRKLNGAACLLYEGMLEHCAKVLRGSFYILPSSIHEVLLMPCHGMYTPGELSGMVQEVNDTQVSPAEILSDHVYIYRTELSKITM